MTEGRVNRHLGPTVQKAYGKIEIRPAKTLEIFFGEFIGVDLEYAKWFVFGVLDVLLVKEIGKVEIKIVGLEIDEICSSPMAFRNAGRKAGAAALTEAELVL